MPFPPCSPWQEPPTGWWGSSPCGGTQGAHRQENYRAPLTPFAARSGWNTEILPGGMLPSDCRIAKRRHNGERGCCKMGCRQHPLPFVLYTNFGHQAQRNGGMIAVFSIFLSYMCLHFCTSKIGYNRNRTNVLIGKGGQPWFTGESDQRQGNGSKGEVDALAYAPGGLRGHAHGILGGRSDFAGEVLRWFYSGNWIRGASDLISGPVSVNGWTNREETADGGERDA